MVISVAVSGIAYYELHSPLRNAIFAFSVLVLVLVALLVGRCRPDATPSARLLSAVFAFYVFSAVVSSAVVVFPAKRSIAWKITPISWPALS